MAEQITQIWCCNPEESWIAGLVAQCEADEEEYELEKSHIANETLWNREPEMWSAREATDPHWPPPEVDMTEVQQPEVFHV